MNECDLSCPARTKKAVGTQSKCVSYAGEETRSRFHHFDVFPFKAVCVQSCVHFGSSFSSSFQFLKNMIYFIVSNTRVRVLKMRINVLYH